MAGVFQSRASFILNAHSCLLVFISTLTVSSIIVLLIFPGPDKIYKDLFEMPQNTWSFITWRTICKDGNVLYLCCPVW